MKIIRINLHPLREKKEQKTFTMLKKYFPYVFAAFFCLAGINIILLIFTGFYRLPHEKLKKEWQSLTPQVKEILSLKEEVDALNKEKTEYKSLFKKDILISRIFADIQSALPKNIWFEQIKIEKGEINFVGYVVKLNEDYLVSLDSFIKELKKKKYFTGIFPRGNINLKTTRKAKVSGVRVVKFEIGCDRK